MLGKTHAAVGTASALLIMGGAVAHYPVSLVTGATLTFLVLKDLTILLK